MSKKKKIYRIKYFIVIPIIIIIIFGLSQWRSILDKPKKNKLKVGIFIYLNN